ncbi:MAG: hydrogenase expression/formation protein HypE [Methanomassiliicoccus sp.]|jgi:hydrogenase expression/formation protein HypE|nr:hydrogenase expression/formation protein HypE [Methanomassiliicoccus sp.]
MKRVTMGDGAGGELMHELLSLHIIPFLPQFPVEVPLRSFDDSAVVDDVVFTTDAHTVKPLFFPGGDIGSLSVSGTVNDIAVMGATPLALSLAVVLAEGLEIDDLERVMKSVGKCSEQANVPVVTGDTKVVESGALDGMIVTTSAIGKRSRFLDNNLKVARDHRPVTSNWLTDDNIQEGDVIIVTGTLGDHGISLLSFREGYGFETDVKSDVAPLNHLIEEVLKVGGAVSMKDPTRGGFANAINEWSSKSGIGIEIEEADVPISEPVQNACELLGLDPMSIGNEGKAIIGCVPSMAEEVLEAIRSHPLGRNAAIVGKATRKYQRVVLHTEVGGHRILEPPVGDPVPRIC